MLEEWWRKGWKDFSFVGKDKIGFRYAEFGLEVEMLCRSLEIW